MAQVNDPTAAAYRQLHEAVSNLHRAWFRGADLDHGAINQACLELFRKDTEIEARLRLAKTSS